MKASKKMMVIIVPLAILALGIISGSILLQRFFFLSVLLIAICYLWAQWSLRRLSLSTSVPPRHLQVGNAFQREVIISNHAKLPRFWVKAEDRTDMPGHHEETVITVAGRSSFHWQSYVRCSKRGGYRFGPVTLTAADPLGIFTSRRNLGEEREITIYPAIVDLPYFRFTSAGDSVYGTAHQAISPVGSNASGVREFASGDSPHNIHWRSTARMAKPMVKTYDPDHSYNASKTAWLLLDMHETAHSGIGEEASEEYAITIAGSLANKYLRSGIRVGMLASDERQVFIGPEKGEAQLWDILESLALMRPGREPILSGLVSHHMDSFRHNPLVTIIATSASEDLSETIQQLRNRIDSIVVTLLDTASFGGHPLSTENYRTLNRAGCSVYTIRKGEDLAKALDSKVARLHPLLV